MCGNNLLTPYDVIAKGDPFGVKQVKEGLMSEMRIAADTFMSEESKADERFRLICTYITYQFHLVDVVTVADFCIKEDCIHSLVYCLKSLIEPSLYEEMMTIKEDLYKSVSFLFSNPHGLFQVDLLSIFTQLIVAAKLIENQERADKVQEELTDKSRDIIKLGIIQTLLAITCANLKQDITYEALSLALKEPSIAVLIKNGKRIEKRLIPFLKKLLCIKLVLFPAPGSDVKKDIAKVGWIEETHGIEFYLKELGASKDIISSLLENGAEPSKEVFFKLPAINKTWMLNCFDSLLKSIEKEKVVLKCERWPILVLYKAGTKKFSLIPLTDKFDDLVAHYSDKPCKQCKTPPMDGAICLLCGDILCVGQPCCRKNNMGELSHHAKECSSSCGLYLWLANNKVIMIDGGHTCTYPSPYVNKYGESVDTSKSHTKEDLTLEIRILEELKTFYVSHSIPQTTRTISLRSPAKFKPFSL